MVPAETLKAQLLASEDEEGKTRPVEQQVRAPFGSDRFGAGPAVRDGCAACGAGDWGDITDELIGEKQAKYAEGVVFSLIR